MIKGFNNDLKELPTLCPQMEHKVGFIFADPPYGVTNTKYDKEGFSLEEFWNCIKFFIKPDGVIAITAVIKFAADLINTAPKGWFRYDLVWHKTTPTGHLNAKKRPLRSHEMILIFSPSGTHTYNPQKTTGHVRKVAKASSKANCKMSEVYGNDKMNVDYDSTERYPTSVLTFSTDKQKSAIHPNQKPVDLIKYLVKTYSTEESLVMDPVAGSGTTAVACWTLGRDCVICEKDETYFNDSKKRLKLYGCTID